MKKILFAVMAIMVAMLCAPEIAKAAKIKKITTTPDNAKIYVDGNYVADGVYELSFGFRDEVFNVTVKAPEYVEKRMRVYKTDRRKSINIALAKDDSMEGSVSSNIANKYFSIQVREGINVDQAWKLISQVMLNYFDEMKTADKASGYMNTAWATQNFPAAQVKVRTMVQIKETSIDGFGYQIRISSEIAPMGRGENSYRPWDRVLKRYETLISEMQQRVGKN